MSGERVERRLAAILAADVAGYSRLMGAHEEGTLAALKAIRRELIDPKIAEHHGRIVKTTGDGLLVEFASVVDAMRCATQWQEAMADRAETGIRFRVGVNLGDIIVEDDDIFGDGVNVAARLEALAEPGGICVNRVVRDQVRDKLDIAFEDMGEQALKNIARPVRVYRALIGVSRKEAGGIREPQSVSPLSIVVLPFINLSNDPEQEYFVDAITDDLTTDLSRISRSFVISRTTAFTYKGRPFDVRQVGRELRVRYVLTGSVRRLGEAVQVNVQLIDTETGAHVWVDRFDTDRANLAWAPSEITARLARSLHLKLVETAARNIGQGKSVNLAADDFTMRGWAAFYRLNSDSNLKEAQDNFERALRLDQQSVDAKVGLATVLLEYAVNNRRHVVEGATLTQAQDIARAEQLLLEAMEQEATNPKVIRALGSLRRQQNQLNEAKILLEKAVDLNPNDVEALHRLGITLIFLGEPEVAIPYLEQRLKLDPGSPNAFFANWWLGDAYLLMGQPDQASDFFSKARAGNPLFPATPLFLAAAQALKGDIDAAEASLAEALRLRPEPNTIKSFLSTAAFQVGNPRFRELLEKTVIAGWRRAGLPEQ